MVNATLFIYQIAFLQNKSKLLLNTQKTISVYAFLAKTLLVYH